MEYRSEQKHDIKNEEIKELKTQKKLRGTDTGEGPRVCNESPTERKERKQGASDIGRDLAKEFSKTVRQ